MGFGKRNNHEEQLQRAIVELLRLAAAPGVLWFHVPNGGKRNPVAGARLKAMGVRAGVCDLVFIRAGKAYLIELKSQHGRVSPEQRKFLDDATRAGAYTQVCYSLDDFRFQAKDWGLIR